MDKKKIYCSELLFGSSFDNQPFEIKEVGTVTGTKISIILSDRSGTAKGCISKTLADEINLTDNIGKIFSISAAVLSEQRTPLVVIKAISECKQYKASDVFSGLDAEMVNTYKETIQQLENYVKNKNYRSLLDECLCEENICKLAKLPASHGNHGVYVGGCLAATAVVTDMALYEATRYARLSNRLYTAPPNYDLIITAGLLHTFGRFEFYDENDPFKKSVKGVRMNYFPILQSSLERVIREKQIPLTDEEFGNLINVLQVAVSGKTSTRAVSKDGTILRHTISLYQECDMMDYSAANHVAEEGEEFFYDRKGRRYLVNSHEIEEA